jgi:regulatory protein
MPRRPSPPKPITPERLERIAVWYLERYAASAESLRRTLMRRVERAARAELSDRAASRALVEALIARFVAKGVLNDGEFALAKARSLHRQGRSRAIIARTLAAKGIDRAAAQRAVEALGETSANPELEAALAYARRRRIGPYRASADRPALRNKDMASLARGGFSFDIANRVLNAETPEEIVAELRELDRSA